jgi:hypothetical protein
VCDFEAYVFVHNAAIAFNRIGLLKVEVPALAHFQGSAQLMVQGEDQGSEGGSEEGSEGVDDE